MKYLFIVFLFFLSNLMTGQIVMGKVINEQDQPLMGATVINTNSNKAVSSNNEGEFQLKVLPGDFIQLSYIGKKTKVKQIPFSKLDTIYLIFTLQDDVTEIGEFTVTSNRIKKVASKKNEYILDYLPLLDGRIILLKRSGTDYFLSLETIDSIYSKIKVDYSKPEKFEQDCYGNTHLICKDSVRQLWISDTIIPLYEFTHKKYNKVLKPLLFCNENSVYSEIFSNHNKKYQVKRTSVNQKEPETMYETWDKSAEKIAKGWRDQIILHYHLTTPPQLNLIENGVWDGNLIALQTDALSNQMISWYLKVKARELNIQGFANHEKIVLFDFQSDSVTSLNSSGKKLNVKKISANNIKSLTKIIFDRLDDKFYYFDASKIALSIFEIDAETGKAEEKLNLKEVRYMKNLKILDGWLYFVRKNKSGFQKLYRIAI